MLRITQRIAEILTKDRAVWFQRCGGEEIAPSGLELTLADKAQSTPGPGIAQGTVERDRSLKGILSLIKFAFRAQD